MEQEATEHETRTIADRLSALQATNTEPKSLNAKRGRPREAGSQAALVAAHLDEIEASLSRGVSRLAIWQALQEAGYRGTFASFKGEIARARERRGSAVPRPRRAPKPSVESPDSADTPPRSAPATGDKRAILEGVVSGLQGALRLLKTALSAVFLLATVEAAALPTQETPRHAPTHETPQEPASPELVEIAALVVASTRPELLEQGAPGRDAGIFPESQDTSHASCRPGTSGGDLSRPSFLAHDPDSAAQKQRGTSDADASVSVHSAPHQSLLPDNGPSTPARSGDPVVVYPPKPIFPDHAYLDGRGVRISAARKALFEEYPEQLTALDDGAKGIPQIADGPCWLEWYETHLARLRSGVSPLQVVIARTSSIEIAAPPSKAELWAQTADPLLRERLTLAQFVAVLESLSAPLRSLRELNRLEDGLILDVERADIEAAKLEGGACYSRGSTGEAPRQVAGFSQGGAAAQVAIVRAYHAKLRSERAAFRKDREEAFRRLASQGVVIDVAASVRGLA